MTVLIALLMSVSLLFTPFQIATPQATPGSDYDPAELLAIQPDLREHVARSLPAGITEYDIHLTFPQEHDTNERTELAGEQDVTYTNTTGDPISELPFRLYANNSDTTPLKLDAIQANGSELSWELSEYDSVALVALDEELEPGDSVTLSMTFTLTLPVNESLHYGILNRDTSTGTSVISHWYPVVAGRDPDTGWMLKPSSVYGDPIFTDVGLYDVTVTTPEELTVISSGVETEVETIDGMTTRHFNAKPSRDFVIVTGTDLEVATTEVDGTTITSWAPPSQRQGAQSAAQWTANALRIFNPLLGEYPWQQLHVVSADVFNAAAVELPQLFIMSNSFYSSMSSEMNRQSFEFTVVHEAVHMWFYSLVGNNQYDHAFIDEGLTNYLSGDVYFRLQYGEEMGNRTHRTYLYNPFRRMIESNSDVVVDHPTDDFASSRNYVNAVYVKAPLGFHALHQAMGDDAFFGGLHQYVESFQFRVGTPADMKAALEAHTDEDIAELWSRWFERREGELDIHGARTSWSG